MSTNNPTSIPAGFQLPDPAELSALASQYFPEFSQAAPTSVPSPASVPNFPRPCLLASEWIKAIPSAEAQSVPTTVTIPSESATFSFVEQARSIFTVIEPAPLKPTAYPSSYSNHGISPVIVPAGSIYSEHFDVNAIRRDFPILTEKVNGKNLIWFDNAATTQKPRSVIDRLTYFYEHENSNVHRGAHTLAARSTDAYEAARGKIAKFINAPSAQDIVFVRGTTEAINLVARSWGKPNLLPDDEVVVTILEHHANIVPWQLICAETGAKLRVVPVDASGQILLNEYEQLLGPKTKIVSIAHVSNALGTVTPVAEMTRIAHRHGAKVLIDGAQSISHIKVDVQAIDCDFFVFSGHKIFAPTGIGALYAKQDLLNAMIPYQGGGNMIADVTFERTVYQAPPNKFEAGTGNIADAVGLGAAIDYVTSVGIESINRYEHSLLEYGMGALQKIPGLRLIGTAKEKTSVLSFVLAGFSTEEIGQALSQEGIAVRAGHHCAQPILRHFGLESTVRPSIAFYNTFAEIDTLASVVHQLRGSRNL
ncbi:MAG TPA: family 2A encapsulin nanocompartment cargo protein cysteine desulfurase [Negativicutes bacterium]|nr:family 2A encapsulin nanocompartment cargo protein cysteine desulfurase [Negativicutes bacterium]